MSPIFINLYANDVPDQGYDSEEHTVLALVDLSFWREKQTMNTSTNKDINHRMSVST